jgi:hypothetical protein
VYEITHTHTRSKRCEKIIKPSTTR